jgi:hypothetical protein
LAEPFQWGNVTTGRRASVHPWDERFEIEIDGEIVTMVEVALGADPAATNRKAALDERLLNDGMRHSTKAVGIFKYTMNLRGHPARPNASLCR